jgi:DMSO/TMAO reductase YedYZ molybdopterin-dependent catalytic subunit
MSAEVGSGISIEELQLAARNHGMPLEALQHEITPIGLHYLLVHYDIPVVDPAAYRLTVGGNVRNELTLSVDELNSREAVTAPVTMECAGNGRALLEPRPISQPWLTEAVGTAEWTGVPLRALLDEAGVGDGAVEVVFTGLDRGVEGGVEQLYERSLTVEDAQNDDVLLAYACNGVPLPPQHGFPLRLVVPGWYGMTSVKWLQRITVVDEPFTGYQMVTGYRMRADKDEDGEPVTRMAPRSLLAPPGIPDFMSRKRFLAPGRHRLQGRAWSGWGPIDRVEVSTDDGATWEAAEVGAPPGPAAWAPFTFDWDATEGEHVLSTRAHDATGRSQPDAPPWNVGGYANNALQRVPVTVRG